MVLPLVTVNVISWVVPGPVRVTIGTFQFLLSCKSLFYITGFETMPFPVFLVGSLVVNYPYDDNEQGVATYSKSPDDAVFQQIALSYSKVYWKVNSVKTTLQHSGQMLS